MFPRGFQVAVAAALLCSACGPSGSAEVVFSPSVVELLDIDARGGAVEAPLVVENLGSARLTVFDLRVTTQEGGCGTFSVDRRLTSFLEPGSSHEMTVRFEPHPEAAPGCGCMASGSVELVFDNHRVRISAPLFAMGPCDAPLACSPGAVDFGETAIEYEYHQQVACRATEAVTVEAVGLSEGSDVSFELAGLPELPLVLERMGRLDLTVDHAPLVVGDHGGAVAIRGAGGALLAELPLSASADRSRPLCSPTDPTPPDPILDGPDYTVLLESTTPSTYEGVVRSFWFYEEEPPMISDVLVTSGAFADPACEVSQSGHMASWTGEACLGDPEDLFVNVHVVPFSDAVDGWFRTLEIWDEVAVTGYEVERIDYDDDTFWTDAGCNTLIVTWLCDVPAS